MRVGDHTIRTLAVSLAVFLLIFLKEPALAQWEVINQPDMGTVSLILEEGNELFAATNQAQVYSTVDQSETWHFLADTLDTQPYGADLLFKKSNVVFFTQNVGGGPFNYRCLLGFAGWGPWITLPHQTSALISMVANESLIFTLLDGISISSDLGETWTAIPEPPITGYIQLLLAANDYLYVNHGCQVFRTGDLGATWEDITGILDEEGYGDPYSCTTVLAMASHGNQLIISMYWGGGLGKLFVSDNDGATWAVLDDFPVEHNVTAIASKNSVLYAGTASSVSGLFYTVDLVNWNDFSSGLQSYDRSVGQLVPTDEYLFKTGSSVNSHRISLVDLSVDEAVGLPDVFSLHQNYPNPFNPTTTIAFSIPQTELVTVKVYNIVGHEMTTLINDELSIGNHSIQWDGSHHPSGVYFVKIESSGFVQTRKMVLLK